jgi:hypothetical protein
MIISDWRGAGEEERNSIAAVGNRSVSNVSIDEDRGFINAARPWRNNNAYQ